MNTNEFNQPIGFPVQNWCAKSKPGNHHWMGRYCILEPLTIEKHAEKLFHAFLVETRGESWTYLPYGPFESISEFRDWLKTILAESDTLLYAILEKETNQPVGISGYLRITPTHGVIEIGHLHFSNLLKKKPAATQAIYLMLYHVFEDLKYRRCEWKCNSLNQPSMNAAERFGFKFEGIFRQHLVVKNCNRDTAWFSIIDTEWPEIKGKFQRWLSSENFDQAGNQKIKLRDI